MHSKILSEDLLNEFKKLRDILISEKEINWIRGVESIIEKLEWSNDNRCNDPESFFYSACDTWKTMDKGNGSFSEYYIWRDDFDERVRLNKIYQKIKDNIWDIVNNN
ncbi:hypothetical protein V8Z79_03420 [Pantoea dispersa]|uniref:hypothetical protein n=1 Tax=Pantoea dispersa TaxID=59814 RepID=UPI0030D22B88